MLPLKVNCKPYHRAKNQYFATIAANLLTLSHGCGLGWLAPALPLLKSKRTPLETGPLTLADESWIGAILFLGCIFGNFLMGYLVARIGSKYSIFLLGIPQICAYNLMIFGNRAIYLYIARFLVGVAGGGVEICTTIFISEVADNDIRGQLSMLYSFSRSGGVLFAFILGSYFDYILTAKVFIGVLVLFYILFSFFPPSPQSLLQRNKLEEAEKSFRFYKGFNDENDSKSHLAEFDQLKVASQSVKDESEFKFTDLLEPSTRKGIFLSIIFPILTQLSGAYFILNYGTTIIEKSGTQVPVEMVTVSLAVAQILGTLLTMLLVDVKGRKFLLILSLAGCVLGHATIVTYLYLSSSGIDTSAFHIVPAACIAFVVMIAAVGIVPLPIICLIEVFPSKMRSFGVTFNGVAFNVISFIFIKAFPILTEIIELKGCLLISTIGALFGIAFVCYFVAETKGKDLNVPKSPNVNEQCEKV